jgi:Flp pilus assembly protein TadB
VKPYPERAGDEPSRARSALNLRLLLAGLGLVFCAALAVVAVTVDAPGVAVVAAVLAVVAVLDIAVVLRRRRQRGGGDYSLFE